MNIIIDRVIQKMSSLFINRTDNLVYADDLVIVIRELINQLTPYLNLPIKELVNSVLYYYKVSYFYPDKNSTVYISCKESIKYWHQEIPIVCSSIDATQFAMAKDTNECLIIANSAEDVNNTLKSLITYHLENFKPNSKIKQRSFYYELGYRNNNNESFIKVIIQSMNTLPLFDLHNKNNQLLFYYTVLDETTFYIYKAKNTHKVIECTTLDELMKKLNIDNVSDNVHLETEVSPVKEAEFDFYHCPNCNELIEEQDNYCSACGILLNWRNWI